jgi:hypothetical protein
MVEPGRGALLVALAAALAACAPGAPSVLPRAAAPAETFVIPDEDFDHDPRPVSGAAAALDLDAAVRIFDEAYAGAGGTAGAARRLPSPEAIARARAVIAARPRWEPAALAAELARLFRRPDGHLAFGWDGRAPLRLTAWPGPTPPPAPGMGDEDGGHLGAGPAVEMVPGPVPRLVVRTFDSVHAAELEALPALGRRLRELPAFVVDLRGNGGGNFGYAERFVLELTDASLPRLDEREVVSVAAAEGRANSARRRLALGEVPPAAEPLFRAHIQALEATAATLREQGSGRRDLVTQGGVVRGRAPGPLRGRAVILVDEGCASACEMAVALARWIPGVVIAGQRTRGSMAAGELGLFRLPWSGVTVSLGTRAFEDPSGRFVETRGFLPDVDLGSGDAALAGALVLASRGREHARGASHVGSPAPTRVSSGPGGALARGSP